MKRNAILYILIIAAILGGVMSSFAQMTAAEKQLLLNEVGSLGYNWSTSFRTFDERYEGVRGSPLLFEDWHDGRVVFKDGRELTYEKLFNVDATTGELLIILPSGSIVALPSERIDSVLLTAGTQTHLLLSIPSELFSKVIDKPKFLAEVHTCGDVSLYYIPLKIFKAADYQGAYSPDRRYDEFILEPSYLARVGDEFRDIKLKKKSVIKSLEDAVPDIDKRIETSSFEVEDLCGWLR